MERLRVMKLIRDLVASEYGGYWYTEIIHGSGSPEAEKLQMYREHDLDYCVGPRAPRAARAERRSARLRRCGGGMLASLRHEKQVGIRARDVDATGHVARAAVALYFEEARDEWLAVVGGSPEVALAYLVRRIDITYEAEIAAAADSVLVAIELDGLGTTSIRLRETLTVGDGRSPPRTGPCSST